MSAIDTRAADADQLKANDLLTELLDQMEAEAVKAWLATPAQGGQEAREFAWVMHKTVRRFRDLIQTAIDDRTIATSRAMAPLR